MRQIKFIPFSYGNLTLIPIKGCNSSYHKSYLQSNVLKIRSFFSKYNIISTFILSNNSLSRLGTLSYAQVPLFSRLLSDYISVADAYCDDGKHISLNTLKVNSLPAFFANYIRNVAIVAHVDHGKTTLTDAILRYAGLLPPDGPVGTYMDKLPVERDRKITIKSQVCSLFCSFSSSPSSNILSVKPSYFLINLIDTPGHADFVSEVSWSLSACEGVLLLIDSTKGIQAQTLLHLQLALMHKLHIVPVLTKMDRLSREEEVEEIIKQMEDQMGFLRKEIVFTSAREKKGIKSLLAAIIQHLPPPHIKNASSFFQNSSVFSRFLLPGQGFVSNDFQALLFATTVVRMASRTRKSSLYPQIIHAPNEPLTSLGPNIFKNYDPKNIFIPEDHIWKPEEPEILWTKEFGGISAEKDGIVCLIRVTHGIISQRGMFGFFRSKKLYEARDVGFFFPEVRSCQALYPGMVGYIFISDITRKDISIGDILCHPKALSGQEAVNQLKDVSRDENSYFANRPLFYACFFPDENFNFSSLRDSIEKLQVDDPSVTSSIVRCPALKEGLRLGFCGLLHVKVFQERLVSEYNQCALVTPAQVEYRCVLQNGDEESLSVYNWKWPHDGVKNYLEPWVKLSITVPTQFVTEIHKSAVYEHRGRLIEQKSLDTDCFLDYRSHEALSEIPTDGKEEYLDSACALAPRTCLIYHLPLSELTRGFLASVKSFSHGYALLDYNDLKYEPSDLVKIDIIINKVKVSSLSRITPREYAQTEGRKIVSTLRDNISQNIVDTPIQAVIGGKIISRETVRAYKKDVTAKIHAGDITRKMKKWADQKKGKKRLAQKIMGSVTLNHDILSAVMGATRYNSPN